MGSELPSCYTWREPAPRSLATLADLPSSRQPAPAAQTRTCMVRLTCSSARHATWSGDQEGIERVAGRSDAVPPAAAAQIHAMAATSAFTHMRRDTFISNARLSFELSRDLPGEQQIHPDLALAYCRAAVDEDLPEMRPPTSMFLSRPDPDLGCPLALTLIAHGLSDEAARVIEVSGPRPAPTIGPGHRLAQGDEGLPQLPSRRLADRRGRRLEAIELGETIGGTLVQGAAHVWGAMSEQLIGMRTDAWHTSTRPRRRRRRDAPP